MGMEIKIDNLCEMQHTLISCLKSVIDSGIMNADTKEVGEVADIIKDLADAEKSIRESKYYELVAKAMEEGEEYPYGYTPTRSQTGNMMTTKMGYKPMVDQEPYIDAYLHDPNRMSHSEYGDAYDNWKSAKKHYVETSSSADKSAMDLYSKQHLDNVVKSVKEMFADASPERKGAMKTDLRALVDSM